MEQKENLTVWEEIAQWHPCLWLSEVLRLIHFGSVDKWDHFGNFPDILKEYLLPKNN